LSTLLVAPELPKREGEFGGEETKRKSRRIKDIFGLSFYNSNAQSNLGDERDIFIYI